MKYSGLYFIPNPGTQLDVSQAFVQSVVSGIESNYPHANRQGGEWKLNHRLFRDIPPSRRDLGSQPAYAHTHRHLLHLSYLNQSSTYDFIQPPAQNQPASQNGAAQPKQAAAATASSEGVISTIAVEQTDSHYSSVLAFMALLWSPQRIWDVPRGITYTARGHSIHIGALHARRQGPQALNVPLSPGVLVCISTEAGTPDDDMFNDPDFAFDDDDEPIDFGPAQAMIKELWRTIQKGIDFGKAEVREYMQAEQDFSGDKTAEREAVVRMWCEALRTRAEDDETAKGPAGRASRIDSISGAYEDAESKTPTSRIDDDTTPSLPTADTVSSPAAIGDEIAAPPIPESTIRACPINDDNTTPTLPTAGTAPPPPSKPRDRTPCPSPETERFQRELAYHQPRQPLADSYAHWPTTTPALLDDAVAESTVREASIEQDNSPPQRKEPTLALASIRRNYWDTVL